MYHNRGKKYRGYDALCYLALGVSGIRRSPNVIDYVTSGFLGIRHAMLSDIGCLEDMTQSKCKGGRLEEMMLFAI